MTLLSRSSGSFPQRHNKRTARASLSICRILNTNLMAQVPSNAEDLYGFVHRHTFVWSEATLKFDHLQQGFLVFTAHHLTVMMQQRVLSQSYDFVAIRKAILLQTYIYMSFYLLQKLSRRPFLSVKQVHQRSVESLRSELVEGADQKWKTEDFMRKSIMWPEEAWLTGQLDESSLKTAHTLKWA